MRYLVTGSLILFTYVSVLSQESFGRRYILHPTEMADVEIPLVVEKFTPYQKMELGKKKEVDKKLVALSKGQYLSLTFKNSNGEDIILTPEMVQDPTSMVQIKKFIGLDLPVTPDFVEKGEKTEFKGNVLFEKDKIYVNIWNYIYSDRQRLSKKEKSTEEKFAIPLDPDTNQPYEDDKKANYYKLVDGQTVKLKFSERTLTTLTIPLKYRFKGKDEVRTIEGNTYSSMVDQTFNTDINLGFFYGVSCGNTKFHHRVKVKNRTITNKNSFGIMIGSGAQTLSLANTDRIKDDENGINEESQVKDKTIGFLSLGVGYVRTRNKFGFGIFVGMDYGVGNLANTWDYNKRLWIGAGIGYDIFKFQQ